MTPTPPPARLLGSREIPHHVLALVPLAALDVDPVAKHVGHRRPEALGAIEYDQQALRRREPAGDQVAEELGADRPILRGRLDHAEEPFLPCARDA